MLDNLLLRAHLPFFNFLSVQNISKHPPSPSFGPEFLGPGHHYCSQSVHTEWLNSSFPVV